MSELNTHRARERQLWPGRAGALGAVRVRGGGERAAAAAHDAERQGPPRPRTPGSAGAFHVAAESRTALGPPVGTSRGDRVFDATPGAYVRNLLHRNSAVGGGERRNSGGLPACCPASPGLVWPAPALRARRSGPPAEQG